VLYGGSVKPSNARELLEADEVQGVLIGGASLDPVSFAQIAAAARRAR
jgi:triosephosphate isomerase